MHRDLTIRTRAGTEHDVRLRAEGDAAQPGLLAELCRITNSPARSYLHGTEGPIDIERPGALASLRDGMALTLGDVPPGRVEPTSLRLAIGTGPDAGRCVALRRGRLTIGRDHSADVVIADPDISRRHLELDVQHDAVTVRDLGSTNGSRLLHGPDDVLLDDAPHRIEAGSALRLGNTTLVLSALTDPPALLRPDDEGRLQVNRPPVLFVPTLGGSVVYPALPREHIRPRTQWLAALAPAVVGVAMAAMMRNAQFLMFALLTPVTFAATWASDRWDWRRTRRADADEFTRAEAAADLEFARLREQETASRRHLWPSPGDITAIAAGPSYRLWERRPSRPHFLTLRLGTAEQALAAGRSREGVAQPPVLAPDLPLTADLRRGPLGIAGPVEWSRGLGRFALVQAVALHAPSELRVIAIADDDTAEHWRWMRWLPNVRVSIGDKERSEVGDFLVSLLESRRSDRQHDSAPWGGHWTLVLIDVCTSELGSALSRVLADGPAVGITALVVAQDRLALPNECRSVAAATSPTGTTVGLQIDGAPGPVEGVVDKISPACAESIARALAPLREATADAAELPRSVTMEHLVPCSLDPANIGALWRTARGLATPVGVGTDGTFTLDLATDGPHALIAGTTGAGKSELLRTIVAGLATHYPPDDLSFVLVDYKGGAAFAECADLPHTLGMVTDLDNHLTARALVSLEAELRRRERAFAQAGAADLATYSAKRSASQPHIARLVIVVDEFATLAEELPAFVDGLVGIAQRGRSLGIHLVLATQRPGGVVSADIRANVSIRIALRVADSADSLDVIDHDAAASIPRDCPGRAIVKTERGALTFQSARSTAPVSSPSATASVVLLDSWNREAAADAPEAPEGKTELHLLRDSIREAAVRAGCQPPPAPWLPPLPHEIAFVPGTSSEDGCVTIGVIDDPTNQRQLPFTVDVLGGPTIGFIGSPRSGRTSALRTLALAASDAVPPDQLHMHAIDCGDGSLADLEGLPHFGTHATLRDPSQVVRLVQRLGRELADRRHATSDARVPAILVLIDHWETFCSVSEQVDSGRSIDTILDLMRDGRSVGVTVAVTGDRSLLGFRTSAVLGRKVLLPLTDRADYALAGVANSAVPEKPGIGRAVLADTGLELQLARATDSPEIIGKIKAKYDEAVSPSRPSPLRLRSLPSTVSAAQLATAVGELAVGCGGDDASTIAIRIEELVREGRFLVAGPARSGRTTTLRALAEQLLSSSGALPTPEEGVLIAAPERSPLVTWARESGLSCLTPETPLAEAVILLHGASYLLIDDAERFNDRPTGDALTDWVRDVPAGALAVVAARTDDLHIAFRGPAVEARRSQCGVLLRPTAADGDLLGIRIDPASAQAGAAAPGRGLIVTDRLRGSWPNGCPVQVAVPKAGAA